MTIRLAAVLCTPVLLLAACNGGGTAALPAPLAPTVTRLTSAKIQHVVIIVQENRSFNNIFYNFPGARTVGYGYNTFNQKIALKPIKLSTSWDLAHNSDGYYAACNGVGSIRGTDCRMNGFDNETVGCGRISNPCPIKHPQYAFVPQTDVEPYFDLASHYVLADKMFASNFDASSYVSHQYIIAGQAGTATNYPTGAWGCGGNPAYDSIQLILRDPPRSLGPRPVFPCFNYETLGDELDEARVSWAYYAAPVGNAGGKPCGSSVLGPAYHQGNGIWSAYQAVKHICYGPDWNKDVISPQTKFFTDVKQGKLRAVSWVVPTCVNSDHPGCSSNTGPSWVSALVNTVGRSKYWSSTAIFIFWDDYGGWYDPVPPPYVDYDGLGVRVPLIIVSPYARSGHISHVLYEHGSILKFVEDVFGLPRLSTSDQRANSPARDCFDFSKRARAFVPIKAPYDENYFLRQPLDPRPPDTG